MKKLDVVTFGEAMVLFAAEELGELYEVRKFQRFLAGAETNVSVGLSRLGYRVGWASKVGNDSFGRYVLNELKRERVDLTHVTIDPDHRTGFQLKSKTTVGDPQVEYFRKGSAASHLSVEDLIPEYFTHSQHLHVTGIPLAISSTMRKFSQEVVARMKEAKKSISFDPNLRFQLWSSQEEMIEVVNHLAVQCDWVFPGIQEGAILTGYSEPRDIAAYYLEQGVELVAIKLGEKGAYYRTSQEEAYVSGFPVKQVVDTVGAGDGFAVGMISGLLDGVSYAEAVTRGNAIGAMAVMSPGDMDGYPTQDELTLFLMENQRKGV